MSKYNVFSRTFYFMLLFNNHPNRSTAETRYNLTLSTWQKVPLNNVKVTQAMYNLF